MNASQKLASEQVKYEWMFSACAMCSSNIAVRDCAWLSPDVFVMKDLAAFWKDVLDHGDGIRAASDHNLTLDLTKWMQDLPDMTQPKVYADRVQELYYYASSVSASIEIVKSAVAGDMDGIKAQAEKLLIMDATIASDVSDAASLNEELDEVLTGNRQLASKTYLPELDNKLGGLFASELTVLAARTSMGKTALAWVVARNVAFSGRKVIFFSLEMSKLQLWARAVCGYAGYSWLDVRAGKVDQAGLDKIREVSLRLQKRLGDCLVVVDDAHVIGEIVNVCVKLKPDFVVIDLLDEINWPNVDDSEVRWYGIALKMLRQRIARKMGIPLWVIHQLNREVEGRPDKRPLLKDLRFSGAIEQIADIVLMIHREDYYLPAVSATTVPAEVWVRKNRQGTANVCANLEYNLLTQDFK